MKKYIPNIITCLSLSSGCIACVMAFQGLYLYALIWVVVAAIFDFCDGFFARLLKAYSAIGKELDSLSDMVSFGVVPGLLVFSLLQRIANDLPFYEYLSYIAFLLTIFSALRLAKFNIDERQTSSFIGLPTPANALFWCPLVLTLDSWLTEGTVNMSLASIVILVLVVLFSLLLTSEIPMFSLKFKNYKWKGNEPQYILILITIFSVSLLGVLGITVSICAYILLSFIVIIFRKQSATAHN